MRIVNLGGVTKLLDFQAAAAEQQHFGLNPGWLWAATAIIVGGSALVISGRYTWFGAGGLGVLTAIATVRANNFWVMQGHERFMAFNAFFEHIGLIAGLIMAALTQNTPNAVPRPASPETQNTKPGVSHHATASNAHSCQSVAARTAHRPHQALWSEAGHREHGQSGLPEHGRRNGLRQALFAQTISWGRRPT